ncbi:MAG: peptide-binding protein [Candidatus Omnitrophica bacterium]|nr:peptide-binding protein [Candidatus Omnitrophota bacterium]MCG2703026.1 peptide-binding protein [Candidatus Omnitrophota bacterium]
MSKRLPLIAVFFFLCLNLCACAKVPDKYSADEQTLDTAPACGDTLVEATIADARTLVPILASDSASGQVCGLVYNGLLKYDKDLNLTGDLAQSWDVQDGGLVIVFHLRRNVKWHDGTAFTADDVDFTYRKLIDPSVRTPYSGDFERVKSLEVIDSFTLKITYKEPFSPGLSSWAMNIMPKHLLENEDLNSTAFARNPVGTGPFVFKKWKTQEMIELEANPDYFEGRPYIDRCIFRVIPDTATMFLELQNLGIDYMGLSPLQYVRQTDTPFFKKYYQKFRYQGFSFTYLGYNLSDPKFQDVRVRQAINYAVDKQEIIQGVLLGMGSECTGPFALRSWAYNTDVKPVEYDTQKALSLLAEAGWRLNKQGYLQKGAEVFEFTITMNQGNDERKHAAEIIQKRLQKIGMKVKIKVVEWSAFINEFINKRKFEAVLLGWSLSLDPDIYDIWHSSKTKEGEFNFIAYRNEEVDRLLEEGRREFGQEKRKRIYHRIHEIIYEEQPYMFLYNADSLPVINSRFKGIEVAPAGISHNFIKWYVPKTQQRYETH